MFKKCFEVVCVCVCVRYMWVSIWFTACVWRCEDSSQRSKCSPSSSLLDSLFYFCHAISVTALKSRLAGPWASRWLSCHCLSSHNRGGLPPHLLSSTVEVVCHWIQHFCFLKMRTVRLNSRYQACIESNFFTYFAVSMALSHFSSLILPLPFPNPCHIHLACCSQRSFFSKQLFSV